MAEYDYLIAGSGLFGAVFAHEMTQAGYKCLVTERRAHIGGNIYTEEIEGIQVHKYGAHIFHTSDQKVWDYIRRFAEFNNYINAPIANYKGEIYNLPFNMNTFSRMWNIRTPQEAQEIIRSQIADLDIQEPKNLEEQALSLAGRDVYEKLIRGYTEKQWGRPCSQLPAFIIRRLPLRFTYNNNYFNDRYQGIPIGGYTAIIEKLLQGSDVILNTDCLDYRRKHPDIAGKMVYTGMLDRYFDYQLGHLEWRSLRFESEVLDCENWQGNAVVNYTSADMPYTRIIEHKHFEFGTQKKTVITREYPVTWTPGMEPYYPLNDDRNNALADRYRKMAAEENNVIFGGRLGDYRYYNMDQVIACALQAAEHELAGRAHE